MQKTVGDQVAMAEAFLYSISPEGEREREKRRAEQLQREEEFRNQKEKEKFLKTLEAIHQYQRSKLTPIQRLSVPTRDSMLAEIAAHPAPNDLVTFRLPANPLAMINALFGNPKVRQGFSQGILIPKELISGLENPSEFQVHYSIEKDGFDPSETIVVDDFSEFEEMVLDPLNRAGTDAFMYFQVTHRGTGGILPNPLVQWLIEILMETDKSNEQLYKSIGRFLNVNISNQINRLYEFNPSLDHRHMVYMLENSDHENSILPDDLFNLPLRHLVGHANPTRSLNQLFQEIRKSISQTPEVLGRSRYAVFAWSYSPTEEYELVAKGPLREFYMELIRSSEGAMATETRSCLQILKDRL